ncbi:SDR family NAD(P)-dependent oxidoreductase [Fulvimarina sp. 2208YS6-2-32]|uniref:SDR family NAD(P)-dependent oxidoreductase n=1 Tax=Fulvimarina uroteuthidis TaxID=3098149 RepID=A0ABU5I2X8_9HYPH|nr:SDR family NAD(P)-dependent oxidoreductase [Fulvimarina sp. 2208YS6-2-32]MDY8109323.1 SDR family NAD(P)-dependent oxidoreductase [Fulvimarina sp. 2208YS6-2-32]
MKRALITGAAAGLGEAMARELVRDGFEIVGLDRSEGPHVTLRADLSVPREVDRALDVALSRGPYDLVVLNAGVSATGRFEQIPVEAHRTVLAVNAQAPIVLAHGLVRAGGLAPRARLVFVSSLSHFVGYPGAASYAASKSALAVYARSIARPMRRRGHSVTLACPGPMKTAQAERHAPPGARDDRRMDAADAARAILKAARAGRALSVPGPANRAGWLFGRLAPALAARTMRRLIYDKLDRDVW